MAMPYYGVFDSLPLEEQAKQAFNLRNQFRTEARELMADRATAVSLYKTDKNLTWEQLIDKQKAKGLSGDEIYKEIIASSQRSRKSVNKIIRIGVDFMKVTYKKYIGEEKTEFLLVNFDILQKFFVRSMIWF